MPGTAPGTSHPGTGPEAGPGENAEPPAPANVPVYSQPSPAPVIGPDGKPIRTLRDYSLIYTEPREPPQIKVHDIITVIVDEKSETTEQSRYNRQKNGIFKAELREFIRLDSEGRLASAAQDSPAIDSNLQSTLQSRAQLENREGVKYRIAATVMDVLPNGTIVLEARKAIRTNRNLWEYSLTGRIRVQDVLSNNTVLSENIAELNIVKRERGQVRDATRRGLLLSVYDFLAPF